MRPSIAILLGLLVGSAADLYGANGSAPAKAADTGGIGAEHSTAQAGRLAAAANEARASGNEGRSKMLEAMMLAQLMQAQKDKESQKKNEEIDKKSKENDENAKAKTVKWDLPKAVETTFQVPQASDDEYRTQRKQVTNAELETVRASDRSTGPRTNEFVDLDVDPFVLGALGGATGGATAASGGSTNVVKPVSSPYDKTPINVVTKAGGAIGPTKSELVPIAGDLGAESAASAASLPLPQGAVAQPFAGSLSAPMVTGNPLGSTSGVEAPASGEGAAFGGNASAGGASGSGGSSSSGGHRGIGSFDAGSARAGTLPIGSDSSGSNGSAEAFANFRSAETATLDGLPLYEGSSQPVARRESDINLFEYATYRLRKLAFQDKRIRTGKETITALPPKQAGLVR
jgi:uncharacterized membrane protein YgcG